MTLEEWQSLTSSPGWPAFLNYLLDYRARLKDQWAEGVLEDPGKAQIMCQVLADMTELEWADIAKFYGTYKEEQEQEQE